MTITNRHLFVGGLWAALMWSAVLASCGGPYERRDMPQWQGTNVGKGSYVPPTHNPGYKGRRD